MAIWMFLAAGAVLVGLDQWMSAWIVGRLTVGETIPLWQDVFHLTFIKNTGSAMGILRDGNTLMIVLTLAVLVGLGYYLLKYKVTDRFVLTCMTGILAGGIGNLIDRIRLGYVVDYFDFRLINFWLFNIADTLVVVGTLALGYYLMFVEPKKLALAAEAELNTQEDAAPGAELNADPGAAILDAPAADTAEPGEPAANDQAVTASEAETASEPEQAVAIAEAPEPDETGGE